MDEIVGSSLGKSEYQIFDISHYEKDIIESLGTKSKFWYLDIHGDQYLFKSIETRGGFRVGEDWAEKVACELAALLGLPHAHYELAVYKGIRGVITKNFISQKGEQFSAGNELLQAYWNTQNDENPNIQLIHDVYGVMNNLIEGKPIGFDSLSGVKTASEFFVGYLMFDVLISNQDRHNENWGRVTTTKGTNHLAPSYDHGASLARNISDEERNDRLQSSDLGRQIPQFVQKAKSWFQESQDSNKRLKLIDVFRQYGLKEFQAARVWLERLGALQKEDIRCIVDAIPDTLMTQLTREFTYQLIVCNQLNLLKLYDEFLNASR